MLDHDLLRRISELVEKLPAQERSGLHPAKVLLVRPSRDLGVIARDYEARLPRVFRFVTRGLGTRDTRSLDLLSMLMFEPEFLNAITNLGERDAEAKADEVAAFIAGG